MLPAGSLVLLRMGKIIARNMLSRLELLINSVTVACRWLFILLYVLLIVTVHNTAYKIKMFSDCSPFFFQATTAGAICPDMLENSVSAQLIKKRKTVLSLQELHATYSA